MVYRGRTKIIQDILEVTKTGTTSTKIMYKAYLSWSQVASYLRFLLENGLLSHERETGIYRTTPKGFELLELLRKVTGMLASQPNIESLVVNQ